MDQVATMLAAFKAAMIPDDYCNNLISCDKFASPTIGTVKDNYRIVLAAFQCSRIPMTRDTLIDIFCRLDEDLLNQMLHTPGRVLV